MAGGGIAGPFGEVDSDRAGDPGEYHHSKNFTKKMAVGSKKRSESSNSRGDDNKSRRMRVESLFGVLGISFCFVARLAAR